MSTYRCGLSVLTAMLLTACPAVAAELDIAASADETHPLKAGDRAPSFTVYEVDGSEFVFEPDVLDSPVVLITFRGGWCPFCNAQLSELRAVIPDIKAGGVDVLFLSGDRPELLYSSLKQDTQDEIAELDYHILSDARMEAASALGVAFHVAPDTQASFEQRGRDVTDSSIDLNQALPVPAVFVIDTDGIIDFAYANPDFRVRLPAAEVKAAAAPLFR
jgi:peroxiredoxin